VVEIVTAASAPSGVEIDAVKLADDGSGDLIVRLHEACGDRVAVTVRAARRIVEAQQCNLLEERHRGEEVSDGIVALTLRPFQLTTLRLRLGEAFDGRSLGA
jgi:alpha-mannosidase